MAVTERHAIAYDATCDQCGENVYSGLNGATAADILAAHMDETHMPTPCRECGATLDECDDHVSKRGRGCCGACFVTDTHGFNRARVL